MAVIQDIPKLYTALAEWLSCLLFILLLPRRRAALLTAGILAAALACLAAIQLFLGVGPISLWIPGMMLAAAVMYGTICLCCRVHTLDAVFWLSLAFIFAEFIASLEWQIYSFAAQSLTESMGMQAGLLVLFYGGSFLLMYDLERRRLDGKADLHVNRREALSVAMISVGAFLISNLSYVTDNTPFSGRMSHEIFCIRTLVDFAGVVLLFSMQDRWQDIQTRRELDAMQTLFRRQYEQYRISRDNIETINRRYHDLKHQIQTIRMESDSVRREEYLRQLEAGMQSLGTEYRTGNAVLDTILSGKQLYCSQHDISMTIVADGEQLNFMETMDICSILGNALDNALESVQKLQDPQQRLIRVAIYTQNSLLMIRVDNYCASPLSLVEGEYRTTKRDQKAHGYGIKSIRYAAEKYGGSLSVNNEDHWFHLRVLIPLPQEECRQPRRLRENFSAETVADYAVTTTDYAADDRQNDGLR